MDVRMRFADGGAVRAIKTDDGKRVLDILAAPFGSPSNLDRLGQYLSARTDFMIEVGDRRPALYLHGYSPKKRQMDKPQKVGVAEVIRVDDQGLWMRTELDDSELSDRTWDAAKEGKARASTGSVNYLARPRNRADGSPTPGEVTCWPIAEISVWDAGDGRIPVSDDAVVLPLRALFDLCEIEIPELFEAGEDKDKDEPQLTYLRAITSKSLVKEKDEMTPEEIQAAIDAAVKSALETQATQKESAIEAVKAMRAEIEKELKEKLEKDPAYRATFNVNIIDDSVRLDKAAEKRGATVEMLEENFSYVRALIEDGFRVSEGGMPLMRAALEESEAAELGPMVPTDLADQIKTLRGKYSIVRKSGMTIGQTDKLVFSVPAEVTAVVEAATIAEEGAYTDLQPVFGAKTATMVKKGGFIAVTEEGLEDQDLFQQYLVKASSKSLALAENTVLNGLLVAVDGVEVAASHTMTDAEFLTGYYALAQEYRDGAVFIMNDLTIAYIRQMVLANPRAYGEVGFLPLQMGELGETLFGKKLFSNATWDPITTAADDVKIIDFVNLDECLTWVERRGLTIFVDPYSQRLSAGTINFLIGARFNGVVTNAAALSGIDDHA